MVVVGVLGLTKYGFFSSDKFSFRDTTIAKKCQKVKETICILF
jgi:hypothetical protein